MENRLSSNNNDLEKFNRLYEKYYDMLLAYCNSYVHSLSIAKDIVQESFISLWENRNKISSLDNCRNYLFVVVRNRSLNHLKFESKHPKSENTEKLITEIGLLTSDYDAHDYLAAEELNVIIHKAIEELPDKCKHIFELSRKKEKMNKEIAKELSISVKTVEAQITKGLKFLREKLEAYFD